MDESDVIISTNSDECFLTGVLYYIDDHFFWGLQQTTWISFEDFIEKLCSFPQALSVTTVDLNTIVYLVP